MRHKILLLTSILCACGSEDFASNDIAAKTTAAKVTTASSAIVEPIKVTDIDAAVKTKSLLASDRNVFVIANFQKEAKPEALVKVLDQLQLAHQSDKVKVYKVNLTAASDVAKTLLAKHTKNPDNSAKKLPVVVLAQDPAKMISLMEGYADFKVLDSFVSSNFKVKQPEAPTASIVPAARAIMFSKSGCGYCNEMKPIVEKMQAEGFPLEIFTLESNPEETSHFGIKGFPTFIFFDANSKEIDRIVGKSSDANLRSRLKK